MKRHAPLDSFADGPLVRGRTARKGPGAWLTSPAVVLSGLGVVSCAGVVGGAMPLQAFVFAVAVAAGGWLSGRQLSRFLPVLAAAVAGSVLLAVDESWADSFAHSGDLAVFAALCTLGFGALPRSLLFLAVHAARQREQARADSEVLKLVDDARLFRRLGRARGDDLGELADVACAVAQRDRLYRLLRLAERAVGDTAVVALYVVNDDGTALHLVEQLCCVDAQNHVRLDLLARGVGPAGIVGLCVTRRAPLRVVDVDGAAVRAHRLSGPLPQSTLCVPLLARDGSVRAVLVLDRCEPRAFAAEDESFALALGEELLEGLFTEQLVVDLNAERRRVARVYGAARTLAGVTRTSEVVDVAMAALHGLCASVAVVDVSGREARVLRAAGVLSSLRDGTINPESYAAKALSEKNPFPHTHLSAAAPRPLCNDHDGVDVDALVDLRVVPLLAHGEARGFLVVTAERFSVEVVEAVVALADVVALALFSSRAFDAVERLATTDGLTGLLNRRSLDARLEEAVARARRSGQPLCVLMTDVDHFKSVNDAWGHGTGDEVLKGVARVLLDGARTTDLVGRLGGEEFVVICEGTDVAGAVVVAERMRQALKAVTFDTGKGPLSVTSSFGVALWLADESAQAMLERADQKLYQAKQTGRDRVVA